MINIGESAQPKGGSRKKVTKRASRGKPAPRKRRAAEKPPSIAPAEPTPAALIEIAAQEVEPQPRPPVLPPIKPSPCRGCRHELRCKQQALAFECLALYRRFAIQGHSEIRWLSAPRQPSSIIYDRIHAPVTVIAPPVFRPPVDPEEAHLPNDFAFGWRPRSTKSVPRD